MNKLIIFYDNYCPNCTRFTTLIQKLDWLHLIEIKQFRNPEHMKNAIGIDKNLAEKQMASLNGNWSYGFKTLFKIFIRIPIFWVLIPLLFILQISGLGQFLYLQLAVKRQIIPLHCTNDTCVLK